VIRRLSADDQRRILDQISLLGDHDFAGFYPVEVTLARLALGAAVLFANVRVRREAIPRSGRLWVISRWRRCSATRCRTCCSRWPSSTWIPPQA